MEIRINDVGDSISHELKISKEEAAVFLLVVKTGRMSAKSISASLNLTISASEKISNALTERGMFINITKNEYEALHPRFAINNRYRQRCEEEKVAFTRNIKVDNIGIMLEKPYEDARTK